jgi:esterase/lipase superfamily enzyme
MLRFWPAVIALSLAGCASLQLTETFPACHLAPVDASGRISVTVFYATNRAVYQGENGAILYGLERSDAMTFGKAVLSLPPPDQRSFGSINDIRILSITHIESASRFRMLLDAYAQAKAPGRREALIYIHGFNNTFGKSIVRTAQFIYDGCLDVVPIVFSWPSRGSPFDRPYDEDSATFSRDAAASLMRLVRSSRVLEDIHVMAHSMGNWIALEALRTSPITSSGHAEMAAERKIGVAILASPDVDLDVFRKEVLRTRLSAKMVVLLTSRRDILLGLAKFIAHGAPRAGDASDEELLRAGVVPRANFHIIRLDTPEIGYCPGGGHRCGTENPVVLRKIRNMISRTGELDPSTPAFQL